MTMGLVVASGCAPNLQGALRSASLRMSTCTVLKAMGSFNLDDRWGAMTKAGAHGGEAKSATRATKSSS